MNIAPTALSRITEICQCPVHRGHDQLIGYGSPVQNVRGLFHTLIPQRVKEQVAMLFDHCFHRFAAGRCPASEQGLYLFISDQMLRLLGAISRVRSAVGQHRLNLPPPYAARRVSLFNSQLQRIHQRFFIGRHRTCQGVQYSNPDAQRRLHVMLPQQDARDQQSDQHNKRDTHSMTGLQCPVFPFERVLYP